jgi:hypothetical protein
VSTVGPAHRRCPTLGLVHRVRRRAGAPGRGGRAPLGPARVSRVGPAAEHVILVTRPAPARCRDGDPRRLGHRPACTSGHRRRKTPHVPPRRLAVGLTPDGDAAPRGAAPRGAGRGAGVRRVLPGRGMGSRRGRAVGRGRDPDEPDHHRHRHPQRLGAKLPPASRWSPPACTRSRAAGSCWVSAPAARRWRGSPRHGLHRAPRAARWGDPPGAPTAARERLEQSVRAWEPAAEAGSHPADGGPDLAGRPRSRLRTAGR